MKKTVIIVLIIVILFLGVGYLAKKQLNKAKKFCYNYNIQKSKVNTMSASELSLDFAIDFKNTSDIAVNIDGYKIDVLLNGKKISEVVSTTKTTIEATKFTTIIVPIRVLVKDLLSKNIIDGDVVRNILIDKSKVIIGIQGTISAGALGVSVKDLPIELSYSLKDMLEPSDKVKTECK